jgi:hypothetical protein
MRTASGLALIALGAILAFAVTAHPSFLNIQVVGWVLMLTGAAGMFIPRRGYGWLRRRVVLTRGAGGRVMRRVQEKRYPPYIRLNRDSPTTDIGDDFAPANPSHHEPGDLSMALESGDEGTLITDAQPPKPSEEVVEEYIEE